MSFIEIVEEEERFELTGEISYYTAAGETEMADFGESVIQCRRFSRDVYKRIRKPYVQRGKDKQGKPYTYVYSEDEFEINDDLLDYIITGWKVVKSPVTKKDVPCTKENKLNLPGKIKMAIIQKADVENVTGLKPGQTKEEEERKNL